MSNKAKWIIILTTAFLGIAGAPTLWILLSNEPTAAMGIIFLSILGFNPIFSLVIGAVAGSNVKSFWYAPFISFVVFIPYSIWLLHGFVPEMLIYGGIYLVAAFAAMGFSHTIFRFVGIKKEEKVFMERKNNRRHKEK